MERRTWLRAAALAAATAAALPVAAQESKPLRLVVGFAPGGATDIVARLLQPELTRLLGQTVIVENRPGANGNLGNELAAQAAPDGNTVLVGTPGSLVLNPLLYKRIAVDPATAFVPVIQLTQSPMVVVVAASSPITSVQALVDLARRKPGEVTYGSAGNGSTMHVAGATLQMATGTQLVHVPYKGSAPALTDLIAGNIVFMADSRSTTAPFLKDGRLRALAVTGSQRVPDLPQVPTVQEAGVAGFDITSWLGVVAPAGTPAAAVRRLHGAFAEALKSPEVLKRLEALGTMPVGGTPEAFARKLEAERRQARTLVQQTRMSIE